MVKGTKKNSWRFKLLVSLEWMEKSGGKKAFFFLHSMCELEADWIHQTNTREYPSLTAFGELF